MVLSAACLLFLYSTHIFYILSCVRSSIQPAGIGVSGTDRSVTVTNISVSDNNKYN